MSFSVLLSLSICAEPRLAVQKAHAGPVTALSTTRDGTYLLSLAEDGAAKLWDLSTGFSVQTLAVGVGNDRHVQGVLSPDGSRIYVGHSGTLQVLDALSGKEVARMTAPSAQITISHAGRWLAAGGTELHLIDLRKSGKPRVITHAELDGVTGLAFSPDDQWLLVHAQKGSFLQSMETPTRRIVLEGVRSPRLSNGRPEWFVSFSPDGTRAALEDDEGVVVIDTKTGKVVARIAEDEKLRVPRGLQFSPDGKQLLIAALKGLRVYDVGGAFVRDIHAGASPSYVTPITNGVFAVASERGIRVVSFALGQVLRTFESNVVAAETIAFSKNGKRVVVVGSGVADAYNERTARVWNVEEARLERSVALKGDGGAFFDTTGEQLIYTGKVAPRVLDIATGRDRQLADYGKAGNIKCAVYANDTLTVCRGDMKLSCEQTTITTGKRSATFELPDSTCNIAATRDGTLVFKDPPTPAPAIPFALWNTPSDLWTRSNVFLSKNEVFTYFNTDMAMCESGKPCAKRTLDPTADGREYRDTFHVHDVSPDKRSTASVSSDGRLWIFGMIRPAIGVWVFQDARCHITAHAQAATARFSPDGKMIATAGRDGGLRFWNAQTCAPIASFVDEGSRWVVATPDGYFDASNDGLDLVAMVDNNKAYGVEQFALRNNRPDIIVDRLGSTREDIKDHFRSRHQKRLERAGFSEAQLSATLHVPEARITSTRREGRFLTLDLALDGRGSELKRLDLFVNGVPVIRDEALAGKTATRSERVWLDGGLNRVEVSVRDGRGVESFRTAEVVDGGDDVIGDLFFVGFGVSAYKKPELALGFAHKDAQDLERVFKALPRFKTIHTRTLIDAEVTTASIKSTQTYLADVKPEDTVVLFIAGHGMHAQTQYAPYYYLPHDADPAHLAETAADFQLIESLLYQSKARKKLFLMDTCESGEADEVRGQVTTTAKARGIKVIPVASKAPQARGYLLATDRYIYNDLLRRSGSIVLSSSQGGEFSYESPAIENGFFSHAVARGIGKGEADKDKNNAIRVEELRDFVAAEVGKLSDGAQHPTIDRDNPLMRFTLPVPRSN